MSSIFSFFLSAQIFAKLHPGLLLVLIGVAGEIWLEWKHTSGGSAWLKKTFWMLLILGLILEFGEAAHSDNEVIALKQQIVNIDPLNVPITAITVDFALTIIAQHFNESELSDKPWEPFNAFSPPFSRLPNGDPHCYFCSEDGVLLEMKCKEFKSTRETIIYPKGEILNGRMFDMRFTWPLPDASDQLQLDLCDQEMKTAGDPSHDLRNWIERKKASLNDLDKELIGLQIFVPGMIKGGKIISGRCTARLNNVTREFKVPEETENLVLFCNPIPPVNSNN